MTQEDLKKLLKYDKPGYVILCENKNIRIIYYSLEKTFFTFRFSTFLRTFHFEDFKKSDFKVKKVIETEVDWQNVNQVSISDDL